MVKNKIKKIKISAEEELDMIRKSSRSPIPPKQVHKSKKAYTRRTKHKDSFND